ncbi:phosphotransferase [Burkholderia sp. R-69927]|nr:phosphotransferase [Burkholderia sp. R-70006]MBK5060267.1 phosphotransferase [Burkholderia sp. R-70199]MBK5085104.1 phosphotransferase [Burkholderia sp. R-69927]MBK5118530.1 phosphotransferase [Burkholderia sp. R-69980]MBK5164368.1 phosphotransferase [Burkholderia sp. R-70211]MBK5184474.1 phosphotransferase [Burkholderia sp. R-69749]
MQIPIKWRERFAGALIKRQVIGESGAEVFRIRCDGGEELFLKSEPTGLPSELPGEVERLQGMKRLDVPGPTVLGDATEDNRHWLLMTAVPGLDLANANDLSPLKSWEFWRWYYVSSTRCRSQYALSSIARRSVSQQPRIV